jgi:hypothetical protein
MYQNKPPGRPLAIHTGKTNDPGGFMKSLFILFTVLFSVNTFAITQDDVNKSLHPVSTCQNSGYTNIYDETVYPNLEQSTNTIIEDPAVARQF